MYGEDRFLGNQCIELLYMINNEYYVLKDHDNGKVFKIDRNKYKEFLKIGEDIENDIFTFNDDND